MQKRNCVGIGDLVKLAFLRHVMEGRDLAVCLYSTPKRQHRPLSERHFAYLSRPDEFRHLAPEVFDALASMAERTSQNSSYISSLEDSGLLSGAVFHRAQVPRRGRLRRDWAADLVSSVGQANLVFLDPENGIEGKQLTSKHVALSEIVSLRRPGRTLVTIQQQSGRKMEARFIAAQLRSIGCESLEIVRFRLVVSQFYVLIDGDEIVREQIALFARKWGNFAKIYRP